MGDRVQSLERSLEAVEGQLELKILENSTLLLHNEILMKELGILRRQSDQENERGRQDEDRTGLLVDIEGRMQRVVRDEIGSQCALHLAKLLEAVRSENDVESKWKRECERANNLAASKTMIELELEECKKKNRALSSKLASVLVEREILRSGNVELRHKTEINVSRAASCFAELEIALSGLEDAAVKSGGEAKSKFGTGEVVDAVEIAVAKLSERINLECQNILKSNGDSLHAAANLESAQLKALRGDFNMRLEEEKARGNGLQVDLVRTRSELVRQRQQVMQAEHVLSVSLSLLHTLELTLLRLRDVSEEENAELSAVKMDLAQLEGRHAELMESIGDLREQITASELERDRACETMKGMAKEREIMERAVSDLREELRLFEAERQQYLSSLSLVQCILRPQFQQMLDSCAILERIAAEAVSESKQNILFRHSMKELAVQLRRDADSSVLHSLLVTNGLQNEREERARALELVATLSRHQVCAEAIHNLQSQFRESFADRGEGQLENLETALRSEQAVSRELRSELEELQSRELEYCTELHAAHLVNAELRKHFFSRQSKVSVGMQTSSSWELGAEEGGRLPKNVEVGGRLNQEQEVNAHTDSESQWQQQQWSEVEATFARRVAELSGVVDGLQAQITLEHRARLDAERALARKRIEIEHFGANEPNFTSFDHSLCNRRLEEMQSALHSALKRVHEVEE